MKTDKIVPTFCALVLSHPSSRPRWKMSTCCTSNASSVQDPDSTVKTGGGEVGVVKNEDGHLLTLIQQV